MDWRVFRRTHLPTLLGAAGALWLGLGMPVGLAADPLAALELQVLGRQYTGEPVESRISRLESVMQMASRKTDSLSLRQARLFEAQQRLERRRNEALAVKAYNQGVDAANQGQYEAAMRAYRLAVRLNPSLVMAYNNLGNLLERFKDDAAAVELYRQALRYSPKDPVLHRNLGVVLEKTGEIGPSLAHYKQYLALTDSPDPAIQQIVSTLDSQHRAGMLKGDYADLAMEGAQGERLLWPKRLNPIPVYIKLDPDQTAFVPAVLESLKQWEKATHGRLQFVEVQSPEDARILVSFRDGPLAHPNMEVGFAQYNVSGGGRRRRGDDLRVSVMVNTGERDAPISLQNRLAQVKRLALHELGHALGIWGHSPDPADIMYSHPIVSSLSQRDVRTINRLYTMD